MRTKNKTYYFIITAMLSAVAGILMSLEFPIPLMPPFYKVDFSDVPSVIATFSAGAGVRNLCGGHQNSDQADHGWDNDNVCR